MRELYSLEEDLRAAAPVVERPALRGQRVDVGGAEALLEEPMRRARGEREHFFQAQGARAGLAVLEQPLAVAFIAVVLRDREAGEFAAFVVGERIQGRTADDDAVVLDDEEVADLGLEQLAAALDERAVGFQRLDE